MKNYWPTLRERSWVGESNLFSSGFWISEVMCTSERSDRIICLLRGGFSLPRPGFSNRAATCGTRGIRVRIFGSFLTNHRSAAVHSNLSPSVKLATGSNRWLRFHYWSCTWQEELKGQYGSMKCKLAALSSPYRWRMKLKSFQGGTTRLVVVICPAALWMYVHYRGLRVSCYDFNEADVIVLLISIGAFIYR